MGFLVFHSDRIPPPSLPATVLSAYPGMPCARHHPWPHAGRPHSDCLGLSRVCCCLWPRTLAPNQHPGGFAPCPGLISPLGSFQFLLALSHLSSALYCSFPSVHTSARSWTPLQPPLAQVCSRPHLRHRQLNPLFLSLAGPTPKDLKPVSAKVFMPVVFRAIFVF